MLDLCHVHYDAEPVEMQNGRLVGIEVDLANETVPIEKVDFFDLRE